MSEAGVITTTEGVVLSEEKATVSTFSLSSAFKGLAASLGITTTALGVITGALAAVAVGAIAYKKWAEYQEELRQSAVDASNTLTEQTKSVESYVERYKELQVALKNAKGDEQEVYSIKQDLLTLQNELNDTFGEEYGKLNLVTDAYKDQTEAIKQYNKELAQSYLNENESAINTAKSKMESNNHYNLTYTGEILNSDRGAILKEIAESYKDRGVSILDELGDGSYSQFSIHLNANAEDAQDVINDFMNDVREKAIELNDEDLFADVLEISSSSLNESKNIINEYGDIYKKALLSEIATNDGLSNGYNQITQAVESYNEAILKSEDPYNDDSVKNAWNNLQTIKQGIEENVDVWGKYESVTTEAFEQANDSAYSFYQTMQNDDSISKLTDDLRGLSNTDLESMASDGVEDSFDKLCKAANDYGLEIQDVIDLLIKLGIIQGQIADESQFPDESDTLIPISETISDLEDLNKELDNIGTAMANIDTEGKFDLGDLDAIADYFLGLEDIPYDIEAVNKSLKSLGDGNASIEEQTDAINTLADQYLKTSGILDDLNAENAELIKLQLERMGITNAEEIVNATLNGTLQSQAEIEATLAQYKSVVTGETLTLANVTAQEIQNLIAEGKITNDTANQMAILAIKKQLVNGNTLNTSADINNLISLCQMLGATTTALEKYNQVKNGANGMPQYVIDKYKTSAEKELQSAIKTGQSALKATYTSVPKAIYNGGSNVSKALDDANKAASSSAKETQDTYEKLFDFFERRVDVLNDALELLNSNLENVIGSNAKNQLIDAQIGINKESLNNYTDAINMYQQKANEALSKIPVEFQSKIVDGSVSLTDFIGSGNEDLVNAINDYQDWSDKIADCKQNLAELKQSLRQLELDKFNNIIEEFTNQFDISTNAQDLLNKQIDLFEEAGELIGSGFYEGLIKESEGQLNILEQEKQSLVNELNSGLENGLIEKGIW